VIYFEKFFDKTRRINSLIDEETKTNAASAASLFHYVVDRGGMQSSSRNAVGWVRGAAF